MTTRCHASGRDVSVGQSGDAAQSCRELPDGARHEAPARFVLDDELRQPADPSGSPEKIYSEGSPQGHGSGPMHWFPVQYELLPVKGDSHTEPEA